VAAYVARRTGWMEAVSPMARAAALQAPLSPGIAARQAAARARHRDTLAAAFAPELARVEAPERLLHGLEVAAAWSTWEHLRTGTGLSREEAARVVEQLLLGLLG
jgi:hypothetical protein